MTTKVKMIIEIDLEVEQPLKSDMNLEILAKRFRNHFYGYVPGCVKDTTYEIYMKDSKFTAVAVKNK